ncbi:uncharacterized protein LOC132280871 isoform X2 [Cornus florida]|uniref:uncharacterized protein LOC132280871 isoform X2 n=1 Tax=Cornus florida TaxID=4283 RepID=UPI0028981E2C|nr:uncharacterized protein LOC132280871 isoform X2 [Cornus florida]
MPLLDIATSQPNFQNHVYVLRAQTLFHSKFMLGNEKRLASPWKSFQIPKRAKKFNLGNIEMQRSGLVIRAVATFEPKCTVVSDNRHKDRLNLREHIDSRSSPLIQPQSSNEDPDEPDEREKLRRMRISKANKGNTPWNKGRKHSAETIQLIKERTRLAMQDQKVKMKLVNLGHAQSKETRMKIGIGVRIGWERRREKLLLQETCYFKWQNLIAEASRRGFLGEEELQWDSYKILDEHLEQEWMESVEQRKSMPRPKGSKRAPKSAEQRRKISEAISAKWAEPGYRDRVCTALAKYHGIPAVGAENRSRRKPSGDRQPRKKKKAVDADNSPTNETKSQRPRSRLKRSNMPLYKDPLATSKLEMIKNIRAQRAAAETKKTEAIERAKLLIAEAEKAAEALEVAAMRSPLAQASLIETRKLIAEAIQSIESIDAEPVDYLENGTHPSFASANLVNHVDKEKDAGNEGPCQTEQIKINGNGAALESNGNGALESRRSDMEDSDFVNFTLQDLLNGNDELLPTSPNGYDSLYTTEELHQRGTIDYGLTSTELDKQSSFTGKLDQLEPNGNDIHETLPPPSVAKFRSGKEETPRKSTSITKKWVRGRLVEVTEEED